jgi:hypothetical protein
LIASGRVPRTVNIFNFFPIQPPDTFPAFDNVDLTC